MFDALLHPYRARIGVIPAEKRAEFKLADEDIASRKKIQQDMIDTMGAEIRSKQTEVIRGRGVRRREKEEARDRQVADLKLRLALITAQKKFTQGAQDLATDHKELSYLLEQARTNVVAATTPQATRIASTLVGELEAALARVTQQQAVLAAESRKATLDAAKDATAKLVMPAAEAAFDKARDTPTVLALQHVALLEMQARQGAVEAALARTGAGFSAQSFNDELMKQYQALRSSLDVTQRIIGAYGLEVDSSALERRVKDLQAAMDAANRAGQAAKSAAAASNAFTAEARKELKVLPAAVDAMAREVRQRVQRLDSEAQREAEEAGHALDAHAKADQWLTAPLTEETPQFVRDKLASPAGVKLKKMRREAGSLDGLRAALLALGETAKLEANEDEKKKKTAEVLAMSDMLAALVGMRMNELVQNYFLLIRKPGRGDGLTDHLAIDGGPDDAGFFAATNSVQGSYNDPANIGKYTYHLTALPNILRSVGNGISVTGLSPSAGGLNGGSCDLAEVTRKFHGTDIKKASVVNSQNKVASSTNRQGGMKVYISQREAASDALMDEADAARKAGKGALNDEKRAKAVQESSVMLRFPLRAEYIGKFNKDPIHLTANLELLDGTPVPPDDIEMLVHHKWMPITSQDFQEAYRDMMQLPPLG